MTTRQDVVDLAREEVVARTKWQHQARLLGVAVDCVGLVGAIAVALRIDGGAEWAADDDLKRYGRPPDPVVLLASARHLMHEIPMTEADIGDVLVLRHRTQAYPMHFAIVSEVDPVYIVHAETFARRVVENRLDPNGRWLPTHAFRFRGLA